METNEKKGFKGFKVWFEEVFWYHYKWAFIAVVFVIAVVIFITVESANETEYDFTVVFVQDGSIAQATVDEFAEFFAEAVGDLNGDGVARAYVHSIDMSDDENAENNQQRAFLYLMDEEIVLYILNDHYSALYSNLGYFDPLDVYGIETDEVYNTRVQVNDTGFYTKQGLDNVSFYACINDWTAWDKGERENTDAAIAAITALLDS